jgi:hypothetical protein
MLVCALAYAEEDLLARGPGNLAALRARSVGELLEKWRASEAAIAEKITAVLAEAYAASVRPDSSNE